MSVVSSEPGRSVTGNADILPTCVEYGMRFHARRTLVYNLAHTLPAKRRLAPEKQAARGGGFFVAGREAPTPLHDHDSRSERYGLAARSPRRRS